MSASGGPDLTDTSLSVCLDPFNPKSYSGTGTALSSASNRVSTAYTLTNSPSFTSVSPGYFTYNGTNTYIVSPSRMGTNIFSVSLWFRSSQSAGTADFWYNGMGLVDQSTFTFGTGNNWGISLGAGKIMFGRGNPNTNIVSANSYNDNVWHNVVATRTRTVSSTGLSLYVDGSLVGQAADTTTTLSAATFARIGCLQTGTNFFAGDISLVSVYGTTLSEANVLQNFNAMRGRFGV